MQLDKKRIVFISLVGLVLVYIAGYSILVMEDTAPKEEPLEQPEVPQPEKAPAAYNSRKEAVDDIEEPRDIYTPGLYDDKDLKSLQAHHGETDDQRRQRIVDSIYKHGRIDYGAGSKEFKSTTPMIAQKNSNPQPVVTKKSEATDSHFQSHHELFFKEHHQGIDERNPDLSIKAVVNGQQTVGGHKRLELRLLDDCNIGSVRVPKNTLVYGFVSFKTHRVFLDISHLGHVAISLNAYDAQDGMEGIYIENSYREDAQREVLEDVAGDVNLPGFPQVRGIKQVFRRSNRAVKVTIHDQYLVHLRP